MNKIKLRDFLYGTMLFLSICGVAQAAIEISLIPEQPTQNKPVHVRFTTEQGDPIESGFFDYSKSQFIHITPGRFRLAHAGQLSTHPLGNRLI